MSFHRFVQPSYPGFPTLTAPPSGVSFNGTTYDLINVVTGGTGASGSAFADGYKTTGPNTGSYLHAFGEDATSSNFNRGMKALAQNCDFLDDLMNRALSVPVRTALTTAGAPVTSIVLPISTFVGESGAYPIDMLFNIVDDQDRAIIASGTRVIVASITGAAIGDGFSPSTITLNLNTAIPTSTQYRVFYGTRSKLATLPTDAFTFDRTYGLYADIIPYAGSGTWADGNPLSATNVEQAIDEIVSDLATLTNGASGARRIGYNGTGSLWATGTALVSQSVEQALDEIVTTLGVTTDGVSGAKFVGYNGASSSWKNGPSLSSTNVESAIDEIVTTLAVSTATSGASRLGVFATNFSGALTAPGGGGLTTAQTDIQAALVKADAQIVARRAFTAVFTEGITSVGGDYNGAASINAIRDGVAWTGGVFLVRRGSYLLGAGITDFRFAGEVVGELLGDNNLGPQITFADMASNTADILFKVHAGYGRETVGQKWSNCSFTCTASTVPKRYILGETSGVSRVLFDSCMFPVGNVEVRDGTHLINCLLAGYNSNTNNESVLISASRDVLIDGMSLGTSPTSAAGTAATVRMTGASITAGTRPVVIRNTVIGATVGRAVEITSSTAPILYENCDILASSAATHAIYLSAAQNVKFRNCRVWQNTAGQKCISVNNCGNILFESCSFFGTNGSGDVRDLEVLGATMGRNPRGVRFVDSTLYVRQSVVDYAQHKWYIDDTSRGLVQNCEIVLDFAAASHGPLALFNCAVDGFRVDLAGKVYYGDANTQAFEFRGENTGTTTIDTVQDRVHIMNVRPPTVAGKQGLILASAILQNPCIVYDTTAVAGAVTYTLGVVVVSGRVSGGNISLGGQLAWGRLFYQQLGSVVRDVEVNLQIEASTMLSGCVSHFSDDACVFNNNQVSLLPETTGLGTSHEAFDVAAGQNRLTMVGNYIDIVGTTSAAHMEVIDLNDSDNMLITDNMFRLDTDTHALAAIVGSSAGGAARGLVKDNVFLNRGTGIPSISVDAGITATPNVFNVSS